MEKLRRLRTERGLSQARLAARAEVDPSTVNQIERGAREASPATLRKLAEALDVGLAELLEDVSPKAPAPSPELPFNGLEDGRREAIYQPWLDFVNGYADDWEQRLAAGAFDLSSLDEFDRVTDYLLGSLGPLGLQEQREQPEGHGYSYGPIIGEAIGRVFDLFSAMLAAAAEKFPTEVLGDELEPLRRMRRKRDEKPRELRRGA